MSSRLNAFLDGTEREIPAGICFEEVLWTHSVGKVTAIFIVLPEDSIGILLPRCSSGRDFYNSFAGKLMNMATGKLACNPIKS